MPLLQPALALMLGLALARLDAVSFTLLFGLIFVFAWLLLLSSFRPLSAMVLLGILWGCGSLFLDANRMLADASWLDSRQDIVARVVSVKVNPSWLRLRLSDVQRADGQALSGLVDVYQYGKRKRNIRPGQLVQLTASFHPARNKLNPGAFDYWAYCFDRHIALMGSVRGNIHIVNAEVSWLESLRSRIKQVLAQQEKQQSGVLKALILADRGDLDLKVEEAFSASGAAHLLAISGLHIGMVAAWSFVICWWCVTRRESWIVKFPVRSLALSAGLLITILYATVAGWPLPTQRAVLMLAAAALAWAMRARSEPINTMLAALILIVLFDPASITSVSLWLSFLAVTALLLWASAGGSSQGSPTRSRLQWAWAMLWVSLIASLATLPIIADVFGRLPVYTLLANLVLVPLYALMILPLALLGAFTAVLGLDVWAVALMEWAGYVVSLGNEVLLNIHAWPAGNFWVGDVPLWLGLIYGLGMSAAGWMLWQQRYGTATCCAMISLLLYVLIAVQEQPFQATQLRVWDVGQGAAASLMMADGKVMIIDVPGRSGSKFNGGTMVASGLRSMGLVHADVLVLSHAQSDHAGGAMRLFEHLRGVKELWLADVPANHQYKPMLAIIARIKAAGGSVRWLKRGDKVAFGDAVIDVLWPDQGFAPSNDNNTSLVLSARLESGQKILFPGDMQALVEYALVRKGLSKHDVLLMPHHGSKTSSTEGFVAMIAVPLVVAQTGFRNHYGFPKKTVVERYQKHGSQVLNTADGAVQIDFEQGETRFSQYAAKASKRETALQWLRRTL